MHHDRMHRASGDLHLGMQQTPLLKPMVGHVLVLMRQHRPAREQGIAMFAMACHCIGPVDRLVTLRRQKIGLGLVRPSRKAHGLAPMHASHLLQAHQIGIELLDRMTDVMDLQPFCRAQALHPFVNIPGGHTQDRVIVQRLCVHGGKPVCRMRRRTHACISCMRGSIRIASALEGENTASAASRKGNHWCAVCSAALRRTGVTCGTHSPNTRSVLRLTSGG